MASWDEWLMHPYLSAIEAAGLSSPEPRIYSEDEIAALSPEEQDRILAEPAPDTGVYLGATLLDRLPGLNVGGYLTDPTKSASEDAIVQAGLGAIGSGVQTVGEAAVQATESIKSAGSGLVKLAVGVAVVYGVAQLGRRRRGR